MDVNWDENVCTHSANCVKGLPQVFKVEGGKFVIDTSAGSEDDIRAVVAKCPSGALSVQED